MDKREEFWPCACFVGKIEGVLEKEKVSRAELARRMEKTSAYVSQVLGKPSNMTLNAMTDIASALGYRMHVVVYKVSDDAFPAPLKCVSEAWEDHTVVNAGNALAYLSMALRLLAGVVEVSILDKGLGITVIGDYEAIYPALLTDIFSSIAFVKKIAGVNFPVRISYTETD